MDNNMPACMNSRCLDLLYNHKAICEALVKKRGKRRLGDPLQARQRPAAALRLREYLRAALHFLNSLNRSLYNFILFTWDISLAQCCFENKAVSHLFDDEPPFFWPARKSSNPMRS